MEIISIIIIIASIGACDSSDGKGDYYESFTGNYTNTVNSQVYTYLVQGSCADGSIAFNLTGPVGAPGAPSLNEQWTGTYTSSNIMSGSFVDGTQVFPWAAAP